MNNLTKEQMAVELAYYKDGAEIEVQPKFGPYSPVENWRSVDKPGFCWIGWDYRIKPQSKPKKKITLYRWLVYLGNGAYNITEHTTIKVESCVPGGWTKRLDDTAMEMEVEE